MHPGVTHFFTVIMTMAVNGVVFDKHDHLFTSFSFVILCFGIKMATMVIKRITWKNYWNESHKLSLVVKCFILLSLLLDKGDVVLW